MVVTLYMLLFGFIFVRCTGSIVNDGDSERVPEIAGEQVPIVSGDTLLGEYFPKGLSLKQINSSSALRGSEASDSVSASTILNLLKDPSTSFAILRTAIAGINYEEVQIPIYTQYLANGSSPIQLNVTNILLMTGHLAMVSKFMLDSQYQSGETVRETIMASENSNVNEMDNKMFYIYPRTFLFFLGDYGFNVMKILGMKANASSSRCFLGTILLTNNVQAFNEGLSISFGHGLMPNFSGEDGGDEVAYIRWVSVHDSRIWKYKVFRNVAVGRDDPSSPYAKSTRVEIYLPVADDSNAIQSVSDIGFFGKGLKIEMKQEASITFLASKPDIITETHDMLIANEDGVGNHVGNPSIQAYVVGNVSLLVVLAYAYGRDVKFDLTSSGLQDIVPDSKYFRFINDL